MINTSKLGQKFGNLIKVFIFTVKGKSIACSIKTFNYVTEKKYRAILTCASILFTALYLVLSPFVKDSKMKYQVIEYYKVSAVLNDSKFMNLDEIRAKFIKPFDGILKVNNAMIIANILQSGDTRIKDSISLLNDVLGEVSDDRNDIIIMNIFALSVISGAEKIDINPIEKIANSKSRYAIMAREFLLEYDLHTNNTESFTENIKLMKEKYPLISSLSIGAIVDELDYIASDFPE